jgi:glyoxylase-like metal-dependent hydrolase (beta-lactamase superfamily II)
MTDQSTDWFEVREVHDGAWMLNEPGHVNSFLVVGKNRACLIDTGLGIEPIAPVVRSITDKPVTAVNTHFHFDHVGGNWEFNHLLVHPLAKPYVGRPLPLQTVNGYLAYAVGRDAALEAFQDLDEAHFGVLNSSNTPRRLSPEFREKFALHRAVNAAVCSTHDGQYLDLGGRGLRVMHTPGHSADSIVLHDESTGILFAGDTFTQDLVYCHFADSSLHNYVVSARRLRDLGRQIDLIASAHVPHLVADSSALPASSRRSRALRPRLSFRLST